MATKSANVKAAKDAIAAGETGKNVESLNAAPAILDPIAYLEQVKANAQAQIELLKAQIGDKENSIEAYNAEEKELREKMHALAANRQALFNEVKPIRDAIRKFEAIIGGTTGEAPRNKPGRKSTGNAPAWFESLPIEFTTAQAIESYCNANDIMIGTLTEDEVKKIRGTVSSTLYQMKNAEMVTSVKHGTYRKTMEPAGES
jgi:3'-phosphoadenosine 5'-phosphosulfate sulfotransferase (PAPS reductase)/FAD synthetase